MVASWSRRSVARLAMMTVVGGATSVFGSLNIPMAHAQRVATATTAPEFNAQRVTLDVKNVLLTRVLQMIAAQAGLIPMYDATLIPQNARISVHLHAVPAAEAFQKVLDSTGLVAHVRAKGQVVIVHETGGSAIAGDIDGVVLDAATKRAIAGATVILEGTTFKVVTGERGAFQISGVAAGTYTLVVRRLGYTAIQKVVQVKDGVTSPIEIMLQASATPLEEVVTTVTGPQRRVELGNTIGMIKADSLVKEAPITTLSQLLTDRVPGLSVFQGQGTVGGNVKLQIRGMSSLTLSNDPIVIVDGIRIRSRAAQDKFGFSNGGREPVSPLNDINPNDIETVEVVKGPSAATLYGTDASNGVIVITTKRGKPGQTLWAVHGSRDYSEIPRRRLDNDEVYYGWGTTRFGEHISNCTLSDIANAFCTQDSVTHQRATAADPAFSVFKPAASWTSGVNVSGGQPALRYYLGGNFSDQVGAIGVSDTVVKLARARGLLNLPESFFRPNTSSQFNVQSNVTAAAGSKTTLTLNAGYIRGETRSVDASFSPYTASINNTDFGELIADFSTDIFSRTSEEQNDRLLGSLNAQVRLAPWLSAQGTIGIDGGTRNQHEFTPNGSAKYEDPTGRAYERQEHSNATSADASATASFQRNWVSFRTAFGGQYNRSTDNIVEITGTDLVPGTTTINFAANRFSNQFYAQAVTLGTYVEETIGLRDRLFLTGAVRVDGATGFGDRYRSAAYPKVSVSWLLSQEPILSRIPGLTELRVRGAYGVSGRQAGATDKLPELSVNTRDVPGLSQYLDIATIGNSQLRPERSNEIETGVDASVLDQRVQTELTWYHRRTEDLIVGQPWPSGLGRSNRNVGLSTGDGFEARVEAHVLRTRPLSLSLTLSHSQKTTKLVRLGDAQPVIEENGGYVEGYPIGVRFYKKLVGYEDKDGDGILRRNFVDPLLNELFFSDTAVYGGVTGIPREQVVTVNLGGFGNQVRLSANLSRESGGTQGVGFDCNRCRARYDTATSLEEQAAFFARGVQGVSSTRLREMTLAVTLPPRFVRAMRATSTTVALSARNLALWTHYKGADPESVPVGRIGSLYQGRTDGIPLPRQWTLRFDLGL